MLLTFIRETSNPGEHKSLCFFNWHKYLMCIYLTFSLLSLVLIWGSSTELRWSIMPYSITYTHLRPRLYRWCFHMCVLECRCVVFIFRLGYVSHLILYFLQVVLPCLIDLLSVLEKPPALAGTRRKQNRFDNMLRHVLTYMEMEHKLDLRRVYARNLVLLIERWGLNY